MPNWVSNAVIIHGKKEVVEALGDFISSEESDVDFAKIYAPAESVDYEANWYEWNCRVWGTKWNAVEATKETGFTVLDERGEVKESSLVLDFRTAWDKPEPIFVWLVSFAHRFGLTLDIRYEEEQGWGGTMAIKNGEYSYTTWGIPNSHADNEAIGRECACSWSADDDDWYEDCPREGEA